MIKKAGFQLKLTIVFILVLVLAVLATTSLIYGRAIAEQKEGLRSRILNIAKAASLLVDGDLHKSIAPVLDSQGSREYKEIKNKLIKIRDTSALIDNVYTLIKTDTPDVAMFIVDSGGREGITAYCGERYDISRFPQLKAAFDEPAVDKDLTVDKWGVWLSGYSPIYDSVGKIVGIVGLDVSAQSIRQLQFALARRIIGTLLLGVLLSLGLGWLVARQATRPIQALISGVRQVEKMNFEYTVAVKTGDEIEELSDAFNSMAVRLKAEEGRLREYYLETIKTLVRALEAKDEYIKGHSERVTEYAVTIAKRLALPQEDIKLLEDMCILHDIGKIGISEGILTKPGPLTNEEYNVVKMHPRIGEEILSSLQFLRPGLSIMSQHHERPDGLGYPNALHDGQINILASIVSVADAFDAMTSDRPYRKALPKEKALAILKENAGTQFDRRVTETFLGLVAQNKF